VTKRDFSDPSSMVGATREEVLAMLPPDWLVRPFPPGRGGFQMISPGRMPGAAGVIGWHEGGRAGFRTFAEKPGPRVFVLNQAVEQPLLVAVLAAWALPATSANAALGDIPHIAAAAQSLVRDRRVAVFEDPLHGDVLTRLSTTEALAALGDPSNWWRDENDDDHEDARSLFVLDITDAGATELATLDQAKPRWRGRR
jgi:hypothetical protein